MKVNIKPKDYQKAAVEFALQRNNSIIAIETGGGKTIVCILEALFRLYKNQVDKVVQVCTKKSKHSFAHDYAKHTDVDCLIVINALDDFITFYQDRSLKIAVIQYEVLKTIPAEMWERFLKDHRTLMQFDEYHKLKQAMTELAYDYHNNLTERLKKKPTAICALMYKIRPYIRYLTGYTATPITASINDAFWLGTLTQPSIFNDSLLQFYNLFVNYNCYPLKNGRYTKLCLNVKGLQNLEILKRKLDTICFNHFSKKDIKFIPALVDISEQDYGEYVQAVSGVLDKYKERKVDSETKEHEDKTFSARMIDAQYVLNNSEAKKDMLKVLLQQTISSGVLVYCHYYNTLDVVKEILDTLDMDYKVIDGTTSDKELERVMSWFNSNPMSKVVILSSAGSQSLNLQSTNNMIFYDLPYTPGGFLQAIGRMIRLGSKYDSFNVFLPMVNDTLDTYKHAYISSHAELLSYLQGNDNMFRGVFETFNSFFLRQMRQANLWNKQWEK